MLERQNNPRIAWIISDSKCSRSNQDQANRSSLAASTSISSVEAWFDGTDLLTSIKSDLSSSPDLWILFSGFVLGAFASSTSGCCRCSSSCCWGRQMQRAHLKGWPTQQFHSINKGSGSGCNHAPVDIGYWSYKNLGLIKFPSVPGVRR